MKERAIQLGVESCPELFYGTLVKLFQTEFAFDEATIEKVGIERLLSEFFYNYKLEKSSILDSSITEEGFCIRVDRYSKLDIFKIKSKLFLAHESKQLDKEVVDIETEETI